MQFLIVPTDTGAKETTDDSPISTGACQQGLPNMALCLGSCNNCGNYLRELDHYKSLTDQINGKLLIMEEDQRRRETEQNSVDFIKLGI
jgi:hypothetical protein